VCLQGEFILGVDGTVEVYKRLLVIFLGLLEVPGETRGSRRTRDGRTPFVRQEQLAEWRACLTRSSAAGSATG